MPAAPAKVPQTIALYVHLPWCVARCPYCDFNAHAMPTSWGGQPPVDAYVSALTRDLEADRELAGTRRTGSVFFGGGTPSLFPPEAIGAILEAADRTFPFADDVEITLEANPGTVDEARFRGFAAAGVNRLSLGVQSFDAEALTRIGRIHDADAALRAAGHGRAIFDRLNLDLMYGLPGQDLDQAVADVETALATGADHVSHYQLTLEPGTVFGSHPPELPDDDLCWDMLAGCAERLADAGFHRYEISAYAADEAARCRHNLNYWRFGDYLGVGAGAHGKLTLPDGRILRSTRPAQPRRHMADGTPGWHEVSETDRAFEYMLNALRLSEGVDLDAFQAATGLDREVLAEPLDEAVARRWLTSVDATRLRPTELGFAFHNDLQALFLPEERGADRVATGTGPDRLASGQPQAEHGG